MTTTAKHTPGPWVATKAQNDARGEVYTVTTERKGISQCVIADVAPAGSEQTRYANARLIASAPDLLAAIRPLVAIVNGARVKPAKRAQYLDEARAAIARAEGGAS